jgi:hypothetical protein
MQPEPNFKQWNILKNKVRQFCVKSITAFLIAIMGVGFAFAAALTNTSDTLSSAKIGANSNHTFVFTTPTGIAAGSSTVITFPSEFIIPFGFSFTDVDMNVGGPYLASTTLAAVPTGTTFGVVRTSTTTITITASSSAVVPAASTVYIRFGTNALFQTTGVNQVINATTTGNKAIGIAGTMSDYGTTTVNILTDDAVQVNAIVPQSLTFSISSNTINFGNLSSAAPKYASSTNSGGDTADTVAHSLLVSTNAPSGYTITLQGQTLTSQQNIANTINAIGASPALSATGTEQFGIYATKSGGVNGTIATPYATASSFGYNATATTSATFASGSSSTNTETYSLHYIANIAALTEAGTYSANLVYVGTSNF